MPKFNYTKLLKSKRYGVAVYDACEEFEKIVNRPLTLTECMGECYHAREHIQCNMSELAESNEALQFYIKRVDIYTTLINKYNYDHHGYEYTLTLDDPEHKPLKYNPLLKKWIVDKNF